MTGRLCWQLIMKMHLSLKVNMDNGGFWDNGRKETFKAKVNCVKRITFHALFGMVKVPLILEAHGAKIEIIE